MDTVTITFIAALALITSVFIMFVIIPLSHDAENQQILILHLIGVFVIWVVSGMLIHLRMKHMNEITCED